MDDIKFFVLINPFLNISICCSFLVYKCCYFIFYLFAKGLVNPLEHDDYFDVSSMIDLREMFDARVHLGHHEGTFDPLTRPYIYGMRSTQYIIDLDKTEECLKVYCVLCYYSY